MHTLYFPNNLPCPAAALHAVAEFMHLLVFTSSNETQKSQQPIIQAAGPLSDCVDAVPLLLWHTCKNFKPRSELHTLLRMLLCISRVFEKDSLHAFPVLWHQRAWL